MKLRRMAVLQVAMGILALVIFALAGTVSAERLDGADQGGTRLTATLLGANEVNNAGVPNQGDPDGTGLAVVSLNHGQGTVCFELTTENIATPTRGHIHAAPAGANGPIVVDFFNGNTVEGPLSGCVEGVSQALIKDIRKNPERFYFNVHNAAFPAGAIRGQLGK